MAIDLSEGTETHAKMALALDVVGTYAPIVLAYAAGEDDDPSDPRLHYRRPHCIEFSKTLMLTLHLLGLPAKVLPVDISVFNLVGYQLLEQGVHPSTWPDKPTPEMPVVPWSLAVHAEMTDEELAAKPSMYAHLKQGRGFNGHAVVSVGRTWLLDANAGQMHRPGLIDMPNQWLWPYPEEFIQNPKGGGIHTVGFWNNDSKAYEAKHGEPPPTFAMLMMRNRPKDTTYKQGTAWTAGSAETTAPGYAKVVREALDGTLPDAFGFATEWAGRKRVVEVDGAHLRDRYRTLTNRDKDDRP